ncbi:MAG: Hsp20/alpha crystallin family protein [Chromatiales bacterium]|jgi:HSP20 family molecular chaperone IbpA|nr:Hsp20/alpha crystallin family protein [Chromatiales bacterium]
MSSQDPRDPKAWMWAEACGLLERAERLHRQFFRIPTRAREVTWEPPADIFETEHEYWIMVALPGVLPSAMEIIVADNIVHVRAERPLPHSLRRASVERMEIPYGRFQRTFELPGSSYELSGHEAIQGCLVIRLHKLF